MSPFKDLDRQLRAALRKARISLAIGGFDISMNEHQSGVFTPHWKPHAWVFVSEQEVLAKEKVLRAEFPKEKEAVPKPVMIKNWDGDIRAIAYATKAMFNRRVSLPRQQGKDGGATKRKNVRYRDLRAHQKMELLLALDRIGLRRRLFLYRAKLQETGDMSDSEVAIRPKRQIRRIRRSLKEVIRTRQYDD